MEGALREQLSVTGNRIEALSDVGGTYQKPRLRAVLNSDNGRWVAGRGEAVHLSFQVPASGTKTIFTAWAHF